jgi:molecular chaperone GrpE (heat shock protein)
MGTTESQSQLIQEKIAAVLGKLESLAPLANQTSRSADEIAAEEKLCKIDMELRQMSAQHELRKRLFEPLKSELTKYREAFLREVLQKALVQDLTRLDDELRNVLDCIKRAAEVKKGRVVKWARGFDASIVSLTEILGRLEVSEIEAQPKVNPAFHRVVSHEPTENLEEDGKIVAHVKRGLLWRDQVLRREDVIAKRYH